MLLTNQINQAAESPKARPCGGLQGSRQGGHAWQGAMDFALCVARRQSFIGKLWNM